MLRLFAASLAWLTLWLPHARADERAIYVFAFGPFGGRDKNASAEAMDALPSQIRGHDIIKCRIDVTWGNPGKVLSNAFPRPVKAVFALGEAGRQRISIETKAYNHRDPIKDVLGAKPTSTEIRAGEAPMLGIPWNAEKVVGELSGIYPVETSSDPGRYLCNEMSYELYRLSRFQENHEMPVCFIHVPLLGTKVTLPDSGKVKITGAWLGAFLTDFIEASVRE